MNKVLSLLIIAIMAMLFTTSASAAEVNYKAVVADFLKSKGTDPAAVEIRDAENTSTPEWKLVLVLFKQGNVKQPVPIFISQNGSSIVPGSMVFFNNAPVVTKTFQPEYDKITFKFTDTNRRIVNPEGKKTVFLFTDPDCPYCRQVDEKLAAYKGEYRFIIKSFPLEQLHPQAKAKLIELQAQWLTSKAGMNKDQAQKEAERLVAEDMSEGMKVQVPGTPFFVAEDGTVLNANQIFKN